jgi:hypothetical protein
MREPTEQDIRAADRANLFGAIAPLGMSMRDAARRQMEAYERAQGPRHRFYQAAPGLTIDRDGEAWWGTYHCDGIYLANPDLCRRAQRNSIERDHLEALRRNDWIDRRSLQFEVTERGRQELGRFAS